METGTRVRLYVGGLGPSVEDADLHHILGLMGRVLSVEMVRSKERDFAYVDFEPISTAALAKVFSTYKGCKWKGGRLRIEKAKEHYLVRLQNEKKSEMDQNAGRAIIPNILESQQNDKHVPQSLERGLNIFFPRFRKVKVIPPKGLGRHKRSFERADSLPIPLLTLCNCDEHRIDVDDVLSYEHDNYLRIIEKLEGSKEHKNVHIEVDQTRNDVQQDKGVDPSGCRHLFEDSSGLAGNWTCSNEPGLEAEELETMNGHNLHSLNGKPDTKQKPVASKFKSVDHTEHSSGKEDTSFPGGWGRLFEAAAGHTDDWPEPSLEEDDLLLDPKETYSEPEEVQQIKSKQIKSKRVRFSQDIENFSKETEAIEEFPDAIESMDGDIRLGCMLNEGLNCVRKKRRVNANQNRKKESLEDGLNRLGINSEHLVRDIAKPHESSNLKPQESSNSKDELVSNKWEKLFQANAGLNDNCQSEQNISTKDSCSNADKWEKLFQATAGLNVNCQPKRKIITTNAPMEMMQSHHADLGYTDANKAHVPEVENLETDTTKANTWIQKASWKSLVGENGNASFSLKSIVPQPLETHNEDAQHEFESAAVRIEEGSRVVHVVGPEHPDLSIYCKSATKRSKQSARVLSETRDESMKDVTFELKNPVTEGDGTVLSSSDLPFKFMRSENAEQEWLSSRESIRTDYRAKHKAALRKIKKMQTVKF